MTKLASELMAGDVIPPPAGERGWLWRDGIRRRMTVVAVVGSHADARGPWLHVRVTFPSPYTVRTSTTVFSIRPGTKVSCQTPAPAAEASS